MDQVFNCPYCGEQQAEWPPDMAWDSEGERADVECGSCEKVYVVIRSISYHARPAAGAATPGDGQ